MLRTSKPHALDVLPTLRRYAAAAAMEWLGKSARIPYFCSMIKPAILAIMGDLIQEISKLSVHDRIRLVQEILQTIALDNRSTDIAEGVVKTIPWERIQLKLAQR